MSPPPKASTSSSEFVNLSYWIFAFWWLVLLAVHLLTCGYNVVYAYCYWKLQDTFLNMYLESFHVGMPPKNHHAIAVVHALMSATHGVCALLMLGGSLWQRTLAFTPWSSANALGKEESGSSTVGRDDGKDTASGRLATISGNLSKVYEKVAARRGVFGVNGSHFHAILICRELVETALQTVQAYRMSKLLPRVLLNRFYVGLLAFNCWSSVIVYSLCFRRDEARRRFACIICDCALDLVACMGVELMIVLDYVAAYDPKLMGFEPLMWYDDEWVARALNEFQMLVVVSWADLASRSIFSLGLISTTTTIKELLRREPKRCSRVVHATTTDTPSVGPRLSALMPGLQSRQFNVPVKRGNSYSDVGLHSRGGRLLLYSAHLLFGAWGVCVLGLHVYASVQPALPQCLLQVRPWAVSRPSCYLLGLDCHVLGITGKKAEVETKWKEFDSSTVVQLLVRHCPALQVPDVFNEFHLLRGIKMYNSTVEEWGASAAITHTNHPGMTYMFVVRVNMTDGLLPAGFQSTDFPPSLYDLEFCVTNLRELPDDLDAKWPPGSIIQMEYSQFLVVPSVLARLEPYYLAVTGNPITELPPEIFEVSGMLYLGISDMHIRELPRNVTQLSEGLSWIFMTETDIAFFWAWVDPLVERMKGKAPPWLAGVSTYCSDLDKIINGTAEAFSVPLSPEHSTLLMDPSEANREVILDAVQCAMYTTDPFYPIANEDDINAISPVSAV